MSGETPLVSLNEVKHTENETVLFLRKTTVFLLALLTRGSSRSKEFTVIYFSLQCPQDDTWRSYIFKAPSGTDNCLFFCQGVFDVVWGYYRKCCILCLQLESSERATDNYLVTWSSSPAWASVLGAWAALWLVLETHVMSTWWRDFPFRQAMLCARLCVFLCITPASEASSISHHALYRWLRSFCFVFLFKSRFYFASQFKGIVHHDGEVRTAGIWGGRPHHIHTTSTVRKQRTRLKFLNGFLICQNHGVTIMADPVSAVLFFFFPEKESRWLSKGQTPEPFLLLENLPILNS